MKYRVVTLPEAADDLNALTARLLAESPVTAVRLYQEFLSVEQQLELFPFAYQASSQTPFRRAFLHTTRHTVYFRVRGRVVEVVAVLSSRSGPRLSGERLTSE